MLGFEALEAFPALTESRDRLMSALGSDHPCTADVSAAVESDVALVAAVLRSANAALPSRSTVDTIVGAVEQLGPEALRGLAAPVRTFGFFQSVGAWGSVPERFRLHALAVQRTAETVARLAGYDNRDRLAVTSLLHDIGKLVLVQVYPGYPSTVHRGARTPEERIHQERRELGVDHALVGGVLIGRWGLPASLAGPIAGHHSTAREDDCEAAIIRLADMLAHYEQGSHISSTALLESAHPVGLRPRELRRMMFELSSHSGQRERHADPSPLTAQELKVLRRLAEGRVYKQIAQDLAVSPSTVRTHLHNVYHKLGVVSGAQAVLLASRESWL
ncbi:MAG: HDOD domain-containing protein [Solirubrobacteraceae bacterium]